MVFWAKIRLKDEENAQELLKAFFKEFNYSNSILIKDRKAFVEVYIDENKTTEIPNAIATYQDIEFGCGELPKAGKEWFAEGKGEAVTNTVTSETSEDLPPWECDHKDEIPPAQEHEKCENTLPQEEETLVTESESGENHSPREEENEECAILRSKKAPEEIPELDKIALASNSFKDFVDAIIKWFELEKKRDYFVHLVEAATSVDKIKWKKIEQWFESKDLQASAYDKIWTSKQITQKLIEIQSDGSILSVLKLVVKYKDFDFDGNIQRRLKNIFVEMGLEECEPEEQQLILQIANIGIRAEKPININAICAEVTGSEDGMYDARMTFSTFVNSFYEKKTGTMIEAEKFIIKLQSIITTDEPPTW